MGRECDTPWLYQFNMITSDAPWIEEFKKRNPDLKDAVNLRVDSVINFRNTDESLLGEFAINYSFGIFNSNFRTEKFSQWG